MNSQQKLPMRIVVILALVAALALPTSACGRKGKPEAPPGSDFPRTYPTR